MKRETETGAGMEFVRWFDEDGSLAELGGKAAATWALFRAGLPVPPSFCLVTAAYRLWQKAGRPDRLPPEVAAELSRAVTRVLELGQSGGFAPVLAVRSSAVAEDSPMASFAGQFLSRLGVPPPRVEGAVLEIWASASQSGVRAYSARVGAGEPELAVLIQPMVAAEAAGVVFTADPLLGDPSRLVVNAAWGLGEGVVAGLVNPDHWVIEKATGRVLEAWLGDKEVRVLLDPAGGTCQSATPTELRSKPSLSTEVLEQVWRLACLIERRAGAPQDIEFAVAGGHVFILQARPITVRPAEDRLTGFDT